MAKRDAIAGLILLIVGLIFGGMSLRYDYVQEYAPGPGFFPLWLSIILIGLCLALYITARRRKEDEKAKLMFKKPQAIFSSLGILLLVAIFIELIGFVITVGLAVTLFVKLVKPEHPWNRSFMIGFVSTVTIYFFFSYALGIVLPKGVLPL